MLKNLNKMKNASAKANLVVGLPSVAYASCKSSLRRNVVCVDEVISDDAQNDLGTFLVDVFHSDRFRTVGSFFCEIGVFF